MDSNQISIDVQKPALNKLPYKLSAKQVTEIRHQQGLTQKELAEGIGVSKRTVEAWEIGRSNVSGAAGKLLSLLDQGVVGIEKIEKR